MGRTIASVLAALAIIAATVWMLPAGPQQAGAGSAPPPEVPGGEAPDGPAGVPEPPPVEQVAPPKAHELPEAQEDKIVSACKAPIDLLLSQRSAEQTDAIGIAVKAMGEAGALEFCASLKGKPDAEVLAALDALAK